MKAVTISQNKSVSNEMGHDSPFLIADINVPANASLLRPDLAVCFWECTTRTTQEYQITFDQPVFRMSFILEGEGLSSAKGQIDFARHKGLTELRYFPSGTATIRLAAGQQHKWLDIILTPSFLKIALSDELNSLPDSIRKIISGQTTALPCDSRKMTPDLFVAAKHLAHCPYTHAARSLYLKSKTLELLSHVLAAHAPAPCRTRLSSYEIECLNKARELLTTNLEKAPTLKQLSKHIGLNETKLKSGFKALFGQTVYGFFKTYRVELARQRLLDSSDSVSEIASSIGYTNISHFSAAFKERHGITPSRYRKNSLALASSSHGADSNRFG